MACGSGEDSYLIHTAEVKLQLESDSHFSNSSMWKHQEPRVYKSKNIL